MVYWHARKQTTIALSIQWFWFFVDCFSQRLVDIRGWWRRKRGEKKINLQVRKFTRQLKLYSNSSIVFRSSYESFFLSLWMWMKILSNPTFEIDLLVSVNWRKKEDLWNDWRFVGFDIDDVKREKFLRVESGTTEINNQSHDSFESFFTKRLGFSVLSFF